VSLDGRVTEVNNEPHAAARSDISSGHTFHRVVAASYKYRSKFEHERRLVKATGRRGRADVFLWVVADDLATGPVVVEAKFTDWDRLERRGTVTRNLNAHRRQVWSYLDGVVSFTLESGDSVVVDVLFAGGCAVLVYPFTPTTPGLRDRIETELGDGWGIIVDWFDQPGTPGTPGGEAWDALQRGELGVVPTRPK
jgi:hypothetical protein